MPSDPADLLLSVLIVSYKTRALTCAAVDSLLHDAPPMTEVIVVDNASRDGTAETIAARFPGVRLLAQDQNLGFGRAVNLAAGQARGRYLLLLNPDTLVLAGAVSALLAFARDCPGARIWGGGTVYPDGRPNPMNCHRRITFWSALCYGLGLNTAFPNSALFNPEEMPHWDRGDRREVDIVTGCFLLIERVFWQRLGGFDPAYFMYGEEADLCLRARALGARPMVTPEARIVHHVGASQPDLARTLCQLQAARIRLITHHLPPWQRPLARAFVRMAPALRWLAGQATGRRADARRMAQVWRHRADWWHGY